MKNTLKLMAVAFAMFAFSTNATAATKAADMNQSVVLDQDGNANAKVEKADQDGGKKECKKDGKKSCCKKDAKGDKKSCDKKDGMKSCCKKGGEKPADKDAK